MVRRNYNKHLLVLWYMDDCLDLKGYGAWQMSSKLWNSWYGRCSHSAQCVYTIGRYILYMSGHNYFLKVLDRIGKDHNPCGEGGCIRQTLYHSRSVHLSTSLLIFSHQNVLARFTTVKTCKEKDGWPHAAEWEIQKLSIFYQSIGKNITAIQRPEELLTRFVMTKCFSAWKTSTVALVFMAVVFLPWIDTKSFWISYSAVCGHPSFSM